MSGERSTVVSIADRLRRKGQKDTVNARDLEARTRDLEIEMLRLVDYLIEVEERMESTERTIRKLVRLLTDRTSNE